MYKDIGRTNIGKFVVITQEIVPPEPIYDFASDTMIPRRFTTWAGRNDLTLCGGSANYYDTEPEAVAGHMTTVEIVKGWKQPNEY